MSDFIQQTIGTTSSAAQYLTTLFDDIRRLEGMRDAAFTMLVKQAGYDTQAVRLVKVEENAVVIEVPAPPDAG